VRSLEFLKFTLQPLAPPLSSSSAPPLPRRSAAPEANSCSSSAPRVAPELGHRLSASPLSLPARGTPLCRCSSRQQLLAVDRRAVPLPSCIAYLNLKHGCCDPLSPVHSLSSSFSGHTAAAAVKLHCRRFGPPWIARPASSQATPSPLAASP
jgi:hypothetical protein